MLSRSNSRKSGGNNSSGGGTLRQRMQSDPFVRKKTVRYIAIIDLNISGLLLFYAAYRLVTYDFKDQSLIVLIGANENIFIAMVYWLVVFALIGLQLVIAFLLLTATKDMTTDPETMMKKCQLWKTFSIVLLVFLVLDLFVSLYTYFVIDGENQRLVSVSMDAFEGSFRLIGVYIIGKFIADLHSIFANPMTTLSASSSPVLPIRSVSRTSSVNVGDLMTPPGSVPCSRTQSMNANGDGSISGGLPVLGAPLLSRTMTVPRGGRTGSVTVDFLPKYSRTPSVNIDEGGSSPRPPISRTPSVNTEGGSSTRPRPPVSRTPSVNIEEGGSRPRPPVSRTLSVGCDSGSLGTASGGSVGRGSRSSGGALILNLDDGL